MGRWGRGLKVVLSELKWRRGDVNGGGFELQSSGGAAADVLDNTAFLILYKSSPSS